jgi:hypothetical protein
MSEQLTYIDHEGAKRTIKGVSVSQDKAGRYWLWSEALDQNLAYKEKSREDMLMSALSSALFLLELKQEKLDSLQALQEKVMAFVDDVTPNEDE